MGDCKFYLKVTFETSSEAEEIAPEVRRFLEDIGILHLRWQHQRGGDGAEFFRRNKDLLAELGVLDPPKSLNDLVGKIESPAADGRWKFAVEGAEVRASGVLWHCATLDPLAEALRRRFHADVRWTTEAQLAAADPFERF